MRLLVILFLTAVAAWPQAPISGRRYPRLVIRNAIVIEGNGTPASGPKDIVIENNLIRDIVPLDPVAVGRNQARHPQGDVVIDATGKYVMPGLINAHAHVQDERGGIPHARRLRLKLWLSCGITTVARCRQRYREDPCSSASKARKARSPRPRSLSIRCSTAARPAQRQRSPRPCAQFKAMGVDGIKLLGIYRDVMEAMEDEAHKTGLRVAHHTGVEETNAWDDIQFGTTSIEHWYGIPDAAIESGRQNFPATYNYNNETDRFRYAGHLWREANREQLMQVFDGMVKAHVAWDPTLDIYEASRDLQRAQNQPWFARLSASDRWRNTSSRTRPITDRTSSAGPPPTKRSGRRTTASGWRRCGISRSAAA